MDIPPQNKTMSDRISEYQKQRDKWRQPETYLRSKMSEKTKDAKEAVITHKEEKKKNINWWIVGLGIILGIIALVGLWYLYQLMKTFLIDILGK